jgi:uncharacterized membrane protein YbhN (UPF0104 family)
MPASKISVGHTSVTASSFDHSVPARAPEKNWRARLWLAAKIFVTLGIFAAIAIRADLHGLIANVKAASGPALLNAQLVLLSVPLLGGLRWWMTLRAMRNPAKLGSTTATFWIGIAFAQILPNIAGEGIKAWIATRQGTSLKSAIHSILFERLAMVLVLLLLVVATEPLLAARAGQFAVGWLASLPLFGGIAGVTVLAMADRVTGRFGTASVFRHLTDLSADTRTLISSRWLLPLIAACAASHLMLIVGAWQIGKALGLPLAFPDYLAFIPLVIIAMVLPVSISGWGVREGLVIVLFGHAGIAAALALAFSILYGILIAAVSLPGLFVWWLDTDRRAPEQRRTFSQSQFAHSVEKPK